MSISAPAPGETIRVLLPGRRHAVDYVVVDQPAINGAVRAARPSRKHPGDYSSGIHSILLDWII